MRATGRLIARPNNTLALSSGERHASAAAGALPSSSAPQPPGSKRAYGCAGRHAAHAEPQPQPNNFQASCWATRGARGRHLTPWAPQRAPTPAWPPRAPRVASTSSARSRPLSTPPGASIRLIAALGATTPPPTRRFHAARARAHAPRRPSRHQQSEGFETLAGTHAPRRPPTRPPAAMRGRARDRRTEAHAVSMPAEPREIRASVRPRAAVAWRRSAPRPRHSPLCFLWCSPFLSLLVIFRRLAPARRLSRVAPSAWCSATRRCAPGRPWRAARCTRR